MAFPTTGILDDFNRGDEDLSDSANWTDLEGDLRVVSNQCGRVDGLGKWSNWVGANFGPDCEGFLTLAVMDTSINLYARLTTDVAGTTDGYRITTFDGDVSTHRVDNGSGTQLSTVAQVLASSDKVGIECIGNTIKAFFKDGGAAWGEIDSASDANHTAAGRVACRTFGAVDRIDDFGGGTIVADGANPKGPLTHPIYGPFAGPIAC